MDDSFIVLGSSCSAIKNNDNEQYDATPVIETRVDSPPNYITPHMYCMPYPSSVDIYSIWCEMQLPQNASIFDIRHALTIWMTTHALFYFIDGDTDTPYIKWTSHSGNTLSLKLTTFEKWFLCGCRQIQ